MTQTERVFITGGGAGLGKALALAFAKRGAKVCIADIDEATGNSTLAELQVISPEAAFLHCDVRSIDDFKSASDWLVHNWGGIDLVVNNAGVAQMGPIDKSSIDDWNWIIDINILGIVRSTQTFLDVMRNQGGGRFLNIASMAGFLFMPNSAAYNATKSAVIAISETLMLELEKDNIQVQVACPAFFRTNLAKNMRASDAASAQISKRLVERARIGADEIAESIITGLYNDAEHIFTHSDAEETLNAKRSMPFADFLEMMRAHLKQLGKRMSSPENEK